MNDKHFRCDTCGANGQGSPGAASDAIDYLAFEHADKGHRVELWYRGERADAQWLKYKVGAGNGDNDAQ